MNMAIKRSLAAISMIWLAASASMSVHSESLALTANRVIEGHSTKALHNSAVIVEGDKIQAIVNRDQIPSGMRIIDLGDATLMPGMIDAHSHPLLTSGDYQGNHLSQSSAYKSLRAAIFLQQLLRAGWTGLRATVMSSMATSPSSAPSKRVPWSARTWPLPATICPSPGAAATSTTCHQSKA